MSSEIAAIQCCCGHDCTFPNWCNPGPGYHNDCSCVYRVAVSGLRNFVTDEFCPGPISFDVLVPLAPKPIRAHIVEFAVGEVEVCPGLSLRRVSIFCETWPTNHWRVTIEAERTLQNPPGLFGIGGMSYDFHINGDANCDPCPPEGVYSNLCVVYPETCEGQPDADGIATLSIEQGDCDAIVGACCLNGFCQPLTTESDCQAIGGSWQGPYTTCSIVSCPQPGACCLPDGTCVVAADALDCMALGGNYRGDGTECIDFDCTVGACCRQDGTCFELNEADCEGIDGQFQGIGTDCAIVECVDMSGACCFDDGSCTIALEPDCILAGGFFIGAGQACQSCSTWGACCFPDGTCYEFPSQATCIIAGGEWQGGDTTCGGVICPAGPG